MSNLGRNRREESDADIAGILYLICIEIYPLTLINCDVKISKILNFLMDRFRADKMTKNHENKEFRKSPSSL